MRIRFKDSDPRAGQTVRMDSSRGQHFVDIGAAVQVAENEADVGDATEAKVETPTVTPAKKTAAKQSSKKAD